MEPTDTVLARLDRIGALDRSGAPGELLAELRGLLREAEAWTREARDPQDDTANDTANEPGRGTAGDNEEVVGRLRAALARDIID